MIWAKCTLNWLIVKKLMNHLVTFHQAESDTDISVMKDGDKFSETVKFIILQDPILFL